MEKNKQININNNCLDIFRIIACFGVFLGHFNWAFGYGTIPLVFSPVPIFFLLSGFFTAQSLSKDNNNFFKKRFLRIYPELWLCVIVNLIIILLTYKECVYSIKDIVIYLITQLTVCQFFSAKWIKGYGFNGPNGALWTITIDIQFYILSYLFIKLFKKNRKKVLLVLLPITLLLSIYLNSLEPIVSEMTWKFIYVLIPSYLWIFILGWLFFEYKDILIKFACKTKFLFVLLFIVFYCCQRYLRVFETVRYNAIEVFILSFIVFGFGFSYSCRFKNDYTYGFYLYHMVIINVVYQNFIKSISNTINYFSLLILILIITIIVSIISKKIATIITKRFNKA